MKVLALLTDAFGGRGGIAQYNRDLVTALAALPFVRQVEVLVRIRPDAEEALPDRVVQHAPIENKIIYSAAACRLALRSGADLVYCGHIYHGPLALIAAKMARSRAIVSQLHGTEIWQPAAPRHLSPLERSDIVLCVSNDTASRYGRQSRRDTPNARVLYNTVHERFAPGDRIAARAKFGVGTEFVILSVARLDSRDGYKGHDRVMDALPPILSGGRSVRYLIAGDGTDIARLRAHADALRIADRVTFLGQVPSEDLPDLYRAADVFALPSTGEGFGIVFLEAMACGTPAIGVSVGGAPDALRHGELGWCVKEADFPMALKSLVDEPRPQAHELHARVTRLFGREVFAANVANTFENLHDSLRLHG